MTTPSDALLKHGYTLGDLERIARGAVAAQRRRGSVGEDAYDIAYGAVAVALYAADEQPSSAGLVSAGAEALREDRQATLRAHGVDSDSGGLRPRHVSYWWEQRVAQFPDDRIVERIALVEILPMLTKRQCEVLVAFAAAGGSQAGAALMLGISPSAVGTHLQRARARVLDLWFEHETPRQVDPEVACRNGHDRATHGRIRNGKLQCAECDRENARRWYRNNQARKAAA